MILLHRDSNICTLTGPAGRPSAGRSAHPSARPSTIAPERRGRG